MLNFLKSPDYSLKFNIPYKTGTYLLIQTPVLFKSLKPSEYNTRLIDSPPKEVPGTQSMSLSNKPKPSPAL
jgi:hypothetical protein